MGSRRFVLTSRRGEPIRGDVRFADEGGCRPVVVVSHGFKGFKDWGFHPWLGERLAASGFVSVHFNFSRNGVGEDLLEFTDLDRFRRNTVSVEADDLATVLSELSTPGGVFADVPLDPARVGLLGHSRGGGVSLLVASETPSVRALVTWAGVATFDRFSDAALQELWRRQGYIEVMNARTGQMMPIGVEALDDYLANRERFDLLAAVSRLSCPYRIVHGTGDESVPFAEAEALHAAGERTDLVRLEGAGHTFGATHPFGGTTPDLARALAAAVEWFSKSL